MDVTPLITPDRQIIQGYDNDSFVINGQSYPHSVIVFPDQLVEWPVDCVQALAVDHLKPVIERADDVEIMLLGCGSRIEFPSTEVREALKQHNITLDLMDNGAACRTYNVLLSEERKVVAGLLLK